MGKGMEGVVFRRVCRIMDHNEAKIIDLQKGLVMMRGREEGSVSANVNSFAIIQRVYIQQAS